MVRTVRAFACNAHVRVNILCVFLRIGSEFENDNGFTYFINGRRTDERPCVSRELFRMDLFV